LTEIKYGLTGDKLFVAHENRFVKQENEWDLNLCCALVAEPETSIPDRRNPTMAASN